MSAVVKSDLSDPSRNPETTDARHLSQRPTFILHRLNAELARICNPLLRPMGVDLITSRILAILLDRSDVYVGDVVELMALPQSTVSHQIKRLERSGLVRRRVDKSDNRAVRLNLTRKGTKVAQRCSAISNALNEELFGGFSGTQLAALTKRLGEMDARMGSISAHSLKLDPAVDKER